MIPLLKSRPRVPIAAYFVLAQAVVVAASIAKVKVVTLLLGAQGIAFYGIVANLTQIGSHISAFGMHSSGVRSVARVRDDTTALQDTVGSYFTATAMFTTVATFAVPLLAWGGGLFEGLGVPPKHIASALGLAIIFAALATAQGTVFKGVGATRVVVLRNIAMPVAGVLLGTAALFSAGLLGATGFFIFQPLAGAVISVVMWRHIVRVRLRLPRASQFCAIAKPMLLGGGVFLVSSLLVETTILFGRWSLQRTGAIEELAFLNASWVLVTMSYGFMQGVMSTWLYPLLTHANQKGDETITQAVDTVVFLTVTLGAAFVMAVAPLSSLLLRLVYSEAFTAATAGFNLALIGLLAQLLVAPILYLLLSRGQDRGYLLYNLVVGLVFTGGIAVSAAASAWDVLLFFVVGNWLSAGLLIVWLHVSRQFRMRARTLAIGSASLAGAALAAHFGQTDVVRSIPFAAAPLAVLAVLFLNARGEVVKLRRGTQRHPRP